MLCGAFEMYVSHRIKVISFAIYLLIFASFTTAQERAQSLVPQQLAIFSLAPGEERVFTLSMKTDNFAEILWLANDDISLTITIFDAYRKKAYETNYFFGDSIWFVAPKDGNYIVVVKYDSSGNSHGQQKISLQYNNKFKLPSSAKLQNIRKINGYDVRIMVIPGKDEGNYSVFLIEKSGILKKAMRALGGGGIGGYSFGDDPTKVYSAKEKTSVGLIRSTLDKTGDRIPDVIVDYYSGGAHCCASTYFINLGETVELVDSIDTGHDGLVAIGKNPKGGLIFFVNDTSYAYWQIGFAGSAFPPVVLDFNSGKLRPNFERMKKPPPSLATLRIKARSVKFQLSPEPYLGEDKEGSVLYKENASYQTGFWEEILDLIYSDNEELAWQYLDLLWPAEKRGKEIFIKDLKHKLGESGYWQMILEDKKGNK